MDYRAVAILIFMLTAQAACRSIREAVITKSNIQQIQTEIKTALDGLGASGLLPTISCPSLNITKLVGSEQESLTAQRLSSFSCYMVKMCELTPELKPQLKNASQLTQDLVLQISNEAVPQDCSLPSFEEDVDGYVFVKCFLQLLQKKLIKHLKELTAQ